MFLPSSSGPPLKIGIIRSSSIGDVVLATSCLHLLEKLHMPVEITWIGRNPSLELIAKAFPAVRCLPLSEGDQGFDLIDALKELHFLVDLQGNLRSRMLARKFKSVWKKPVYTNPRFGMHRRKLVFEARLRGRRSPLPAVSRRAVTKQYRTMANTLQMALEQQLPPELRNDLSGFDPFPRFGTISDHPTKPWMKELNFGCWLAVAAGASYEAKRAPLGVLAKIVSRTRDRYYQIRGNSELPLGLLFLGDQNDRQTSLKLLDLLGWNDPVLNMAGNLSLWESAQALHGRACLLTNDSSLAHIAEAVGTPSTVLFGPTVEQFGFAPRMELSRGFSVPLGCRPCSRHGQARCRYGDQLCFSSLPVEDISGYVVNLLVRKIHKPGGATP